MNKNPCPKWLVWKDAGDVVDRIEATFVHVTLRPTKRRCYPSGTNAQGYFTLHLQSPACAGRLHFCFHHFR